MQARLSVSARAMDTKGIFVGFRERLHTRRLGFVPVRNQRLSLFCFIQLQVVDMDRCEVLAPPLTTIIKPLRELIARTPSSYSS